MCTSIGKRENNSYITKTLTFSTLGPDFRDKQSKFRKNNFIFLILATQDHVYVLSFRFHQILRKLESPPGNDVSNKLLTPPDTPHYSDHFNVNHKSVR